MLKRLTDIVLSLAALVLLGPLMLLIALAVRLESKGPALFRQKRAGWKGRPFVMYKFRSMRTDVDPYGMSPQSGSDPRMTRVGKFLRETSLDELPQIFNILAGSMSLVGPRPLYERQAQTWDENQRRRLDVRPGLTGYAQAYGRASLPIEDKIEMDLHYVDHRSWLLDLRILLRTFVNVFRRDKDVYETQYSREKKRERDREESENV
jgi:lipopolysaccharide/colanic/teichoic acid biosynthesis glycosyltransferase